MATSCTVLGPPSDLQKVSRIDASPLQVEICATNIGDTYFVRLQEILRRSGGAAISKVDHWTVLYRPPAGQDNIYLRFVIVVAALPPGETLADITGRLAGIITTWLREEGASYRELYFFDPDRMLSRAMTYRDGKTEDRAILAPQPVREIWTAYEGGVSQDDAFVSLFARSLTSPKSR